MRPSATDGNRPECLITTNTRSIDRETWRRRARVLTHPYRSGRPTRLKLFSSFGTASFGCNDGPRRRRVDDKLKDIRPCIMTHDVEVKLAAHDLVQVEIRREDAGLVIKRPGDHLPQGVDDAASTTRHDCLWIAPLHRRINFGIIRASRKLVRREDEAPALERDVPHGRLPRFAVVGRQAQ